MGKCACRQRRANHGAPVAGKAAQAKVTTLPVQRFLQLRRQDTQLPYLTMCQLPVILCDRVMG